MVLNDIIDQVSERPQSKATHFSSAYQVRYFPIKHSPIWLFLFAGRRWRGTQDEGHCVRLHQENLGRDVCVGLLLAVDQDCRGTHATKHYSQMYLK